MTRRQLVGVLVVAMATGMVATRFLRAASDTAAAGRANACRSFRPSALSANVANGVPPDFSLQDQNGRKWSLRDFRGRPVLLNFWATWCAPCVEEMPALEELAARVGDRAVVLAISNDDEWETVKRFFGHRGTKMSVLLDSAQDVRKRFGTEKLPETYLIDAEGKIRHLIVNTRKWNSGEAALCLDSLR